MGAASAQPSLRQQLTRLRETMRANGATTEQIAAQIGARLRVKPRVAWRHALGLTQQQVAVLYNDQWPEPAPKTHKDVSYWERWDGPGSAPSTSARAPSTRDLVRLATLYGCGVDDLLREHAEQPGSRLGELAHQMRPHLGDAGAAEVTRRIQTAARA